MVEEDQWADPGPLPLLQAMPIELVDLIYRNVPEGVKVYNAYGEAGPGWPLLPLPA